MGNFTVLLPNSLLEIGSFARDVCNSRTNCGLRYAGSFLTLCCLDCLFRLLRHAATVSICADVTLWRFGILLRERAMWHVEHSAGEFRLCRNRVAVAAQSQCSMAEVYQPGMSRAKISGAA